MSPALLPLAVIGQICGQLSISASGAIQDPASRDAPLNLFRSTTNGQIAHRARSTYAERRLSFTLNLDRPASVKPRRALIAANAQAGARIRLRSKAHRFTAHLNLMLAGQTGGPHPSLGSTGATTGFELDSELASAVQLTLAVRHTESSGFARRLSTAQGRLVLQLSDQQRLEVEASLRSTFLANVGAEIQRSFAFHYGLRDGIKRGGLRLRLQRHGQDDVLTQRAAVEAYLELEIGGETHLRGSAGIRSGGLVPYFDLSLASRLGGVELRVGLSVQRFARERQASIELTRRFRVRGRTVALAVEGSVLQNPQMEGSMTVRADASAALRLVEVHGVPLHLRMSYGLRLSGDQGGEHLAMLGAWVSW